MLTKRQIGALVSVRQETEMAQVIGMTHFPKGKLGAGIGWTVLDQLEEKGLIKYYGNGSARNIAITDEGRQASENLSAVPQPRTTRLKMLEPRLKALEPRIKPLK